MPEIPEPSGYINLGKLGKFTLHKKGYVTLMIISLILIIVSLINMFFFDTRYWKGWFYYGVMGYFLTIIVVLIQQSYTFTQFGLLKEFFKKTLFIPYGLCFGFYLEDGNHLEGSSECNLIPLFPGLLCVHGAANNNNSFEGLYSFKNIVFIPFTLCLIPLYILVAIPVGILIGCWYLLKLVCSEINKTTFSTNHLNLCGWCELDRGVERGELDP